MIKQAHVEVFRQSDNGIETLGDMRVYDENKKEVFKCETLELSWKNNQKKISCIPKSLYGWEKVPATANIPYEHILIKHVPGRDGICIHRANFVKQLKGCIAVGANEIDIDGDGQKDVTSSAATFDKLMAILPNVGTILIH